jgi:glutathione peroxidase
MLTRLLVAFLAFFAGCSVAAGEAGMSAYDFRFTSIEGQPLPLAIYRGKVLLVVNTASRCGFTHQYGDLQAVWDSYRGRGLVVLGVPSNDFGAQEPGTEKEIKTFCQVNFDVDFPMTTKVHVKGDNAHPFYKWAGGQVGMAGVPQWNFHKYLIGPDGALIDWFSTPTAPTSGKIKRAIEAQLSKTAAGDPVD